MKNRITIAGIPFDPVTYKDVLHRVVAWMEEKGKHILTTPNPEMVLEAAKNPEFLRVLQASDLSVPDGIGILWASFYLSLPRRKTAAGRLFQLFSSLARIAFAPASIRKILPERVTGTDLLFRIVELSQKQHWRIFFLGAEPGVAEKAIGNLLKRYPEAVFAGAYAGSPAADEEKEIRDRIDRSRADLLFVAYGHPHQELWIARNLPRLSTVKVAAGVGGALDFAAGIIRRAPAAFRKTGLEWLYRLIRQPKRFRRIWNATVVFMRAVYKIKNR